MDELTLLRKLGEEIDTTTGVPGPRTRQRVVSGMAASARRPRPVLRRAVPVGAVLLAGGLAVPVGVAGLGTDATTSPAARDATPPATGTGGATLGARDILLAAARTARTSDDPVPDGKDFVYTLTKERGASVAGAEGGSTVGPFAGEREAWLSVDGSRAGAVTPSGDDFLIEIPPGETSPAYRRDLPGDVAGMRQYLYGKAIDGNGEGPSQHAIAFQAGMSLAQESLLPSATRAALFEAMAGIPGVDVVGDAVNVDNKPGVAVAIRNGAHREELIFDRNEHRVIGSRSVFEGGVRGGRVTYSSAVLEMAVVDEVRKRPDGTFREGEIRGETKGDAAGPDGGLTAASGVGPTAPRT